MNPNKPKDIHSRVRRCGQAWIRKDDLGLWQEAIDDHGFLVVVGACREALDRGLRAEYDVVLGIIAEFI